MKFKEIFVYVFLLVFILFFVCGQAGCPGSESEAKKIGLDFSLSTGVSYLNSGGLLEQGDTFYVGVEIENYDQEAKSGQVCINDDVSDNFGGIYEGECQNFNVEAAQVIKKETSGYLGKETKEETVPGKVKVYFPEAGEYSYYGLPESERPWSQKLFVSLKYREITQATATVTVPDTTQPVLNQDPAPIAISVAKEIHKKQEGYKIDLDVILKKQQQARIFSPDFNYENFTYFKAELVPLTMTCSVAGQPITDLVEFRNEKLIKCSSLVYLASEVQQSYPMVITVDYGVALEKNYVFGIQTKIE